MHLVFSTFLKGKEHVLFVAGGTVVILWQMLLPGYVLTLDLVFGPRAEMPSFDGISATGFPVSYAIYLAHLVADGWVVEKIILFELFFALFYLPFRFYPFESVYGERYFAALFFAVNPFVYERLLAGHWRVLAGYALLFPLVYYLLRFWRDVSWRPILEATATLILVSAFSLHIFVMGVLVFATTATVAAIHQLARGERALYRIAATRSVAAAFLIVTISLYWIIPILTGNNIVDTFDTAHWEAFKTASDPYLGPIGNVAALYGFWGEREVWSTYFTWPKDNVLLWMFAGLMLAIILACGVWRGLRERSTRLVSIWLLCIALLSLVFSVGIGDSFVRNFNLWLFEHVPFWQGFRDTQKWSALLALVYALFGGIGAGWILSKIADRQFRTIALMFLCSLPFLYTPMLFGFRQLQPVWYPDSWYETNEVLKSDPDCKAVFLPWHLYYSLSFNNNLITANTAPNFFDCEIVSASGAEIGGISSHGVYGESYDRIETAVTDNDHSSIASTIATLRDEKIKYVIFTDDLIRDDIYSYPFLTDASMEVVYQGTVDNYAIIVFRL